MIEKAIVEKLKLKNQTIAFAESVTGGGLSFKIVNVPGASKVFKGALVAYDKTIKTKILKIKPALIEKHTTVSLEVAIEMAKNIKKIFNTDIGVGITGNAGPTYEEHTNEKICYIALALNNKIKTEKYFIKSMERTESITEIILFVLNYIFTEI